MEAYDSLLQYSFRLLGIKQYTESQLLNKLKLRAKKVGFDETAVHNVVSRLKELNYINDEQVVRNYLEYHLPIRPVGKWGFIRDMQKKGVEKDQAIGAWGAKEVDETALIAGLLQKKERLFADLPLQKKKQKIQRLLASRGFSANLIWAVLDKIKK